MQRTNNTIKKIKKKKKKICETASHCSTAWCAVFIKFSHSRGSSHKYFQHLCIYKYINFVADSTVERERERELGKMVADIFEGCVYQEPSSVYKTCYYVATLLLLLLLGVLEVLGKHLQYSKFWNFGSNTPAKSLLSSKTGMLIIYTPALFACISSFWLIPDGGLRFLILKSALTIHFLKRDLEVFHLSLSLSLVLLFNINNLFDFFLIDGSPLFLWW